MDCFAAIDIGSNAIRLVIAKPSENLSNKIKVVCKKRYPFRLGTEAFSEAQQFSNETIDHAVKLFCQIKKELKLYSVSNYLAFATSAFRDAKNSLELASKIEKKSGIFIKELSGALEADIIQSSVLTGMEMSHEHDYLLVDLGGGSVELSQVEHGQIVGAQSFDLGTVRMLAKNYKSESEIQKDLDETKERILGFLDEKIVRSQALNMIGTGGNFRRLAKINNKIRQDKDKKTLSYIVPSELAYTRFHMSELSIVERVKRFQLKEDQAEVIIPALYIIEMLVDALPIHKIYAPKASLADGILKKLLLDNQGALETTVLL